MCDVERPTDKRVQEEHGSAGQFYSPILYVIYVTMPEKLIGDTLLSDQKLKRVTNIGSVTRVHKTRH